MISTLEEVLRRRATLRIPLRQKIEESLVEDGSSRNVRGEYRPFLAASNTRERLIKELAEGEHPRLAGLLAAEALKESRVEDFLFLVPQTDPKEDA